MPLSPDDLRNEAYKLLERDKARSVSYPAYKGQMTAPMSSMTQQARQLREHYAGKKAPHQDKISTLLNRNNTGFSPESIAQQMQMLAQGQQGFNQGKALGVLQKQFGAAYDPSRYNRKSSKDIGRGLEDFSKRFGELGQTNANLEQGRNRSAAKTMQNLADQKRERRESVMGNLEQFGSQQHAHTNMSNQVNRNLFDEELNAPQRRREMLEQALASIGTPGSETTPEVEGAQGQQIIKALRGYGIDPSKEPKEWDNSRTQQPQYKGQLVANLPPEILASQDLLSRLDPKYREVGYDKKKELMRNVMGTDNVASSVLSGMPETMRPQYDSLEVEAKRRLKQDMKGINNRYIQNNQYGSPMHMKDAEDRAREINRATLEQRNKMLEDTTRNQLGLKHQEQINNIKQMGMIGNQGQKEFGDVMGNIVNLNKLGSEKFKNNQGENEELYKNFQNESLWSMPHMRNTMKNEAYNNVFQGARNQGLDLSNLANLNTGYNELEKQVARFSTENNGLRSQLMNLQQAQEARQQAVQQAQARAQQENAAREAQQQQQRQQEQQRQQAAQQAEMQRLEALRPRESQEAINNRNEQEISGRKWNEFLSRYPAYPGKNIPAGQPGLYDKQAWDTLLQRIREGGGNVHNLLNQTPREKIAEWMDHLSTEIFHRNFPTGRNFTKLTFAQPK
jgi:hypothetical protein